MKIETSSTTNALRNGNINSFHRKFEEAITKIVSIHLRKIKMVQMLVIFVSTYRGKAGKNANFEALPEDWRERLLKKRKMMESS